MSGATAMNSAVPVGADMQPHAAMIVSLKLIFCMIEQTELCICDMLARHVCICLART